MSEWKSVSIRGKLSDAIDDVINKTFDEFDKPRWGSRSEFIEDAIEEKLRLLLQEVLAK